MGIAHAIAVAPEVAQHFADSLSTRALLALTGKRANHLLDAIGIVEQEVTQLVELSVPYRIILTVAGIERGIQLLRGVIEVDHRGGPGRERIEIAPVVVRPVGDGDHLEFGPIATSSSSTTCSRLFNARLVRSRLAMTGFGSKATILEPDPAASHKATV